ncbi:uncharacterized protein [Macrobrachium rosenbergii]|uniref:uncharacterized protein n=1 Tax=Macrobrachium rosenbergii TaxID=79674 RepID=UPI0034D519ED
MVGACLQSFWSVWQSFGAEPWVLKVLKEGYVVPFVTPPPLSPTPISFPVYHHHIEKFPVLQEIIQSLLKEVIEPVLDKSLGFYNRLFLVPKASGGWRPVLDVSSLDEFVRLTPFMMESPNSVVASFQKGDWMMSIDMQDAYFHVPSKFLRFVFEGRIFQFKALCFGLSTAPQVFTRVLAPLAG